MGTLTAAGLEGVIAGESEICYIDGHQGILSYRGYNIHTLADNAIFEEVVFLLWNGWLPKQAELDQLKKDLVAARDLPQPVVDFLAGAPKVNTMDLLRTAVSMLGLYDPEAQDMSAEANHRKAVRLMAKTATIVTTYDRLRNGKSLIAGDPSLGFAANFLYTLTGKRPDDVMERAFDVALTLHADHELNASTFAARVVAATLSDIYSAITAGIGALKGPLHGGANQDVINWLLKLGDEDSAKDAVKGTLAKKVKIPGFGHRVYRTEDPRATHLRVLSEELGKRTGHEKLYRLSRVMEETVMGEKGLNPNVDFYSASAYYSLGIPIDIYTPIFAVSRMSGWTAHVLEQYRNNRLIRPRAEYKGKPDGQPWIPMPER
ncbi:MAG TPA: citrate synthase [Candidatus Acidoferrales bacterium]|nr:citrate synthase [Candidatus Acidoferrales bacterium]